MASSSGVKNDAMQNSTDANNRASAISGQLNPLYSQLTSGSVGYTPQQMTDMQTATGQGLGGGVAAATGQNALYAARTGNVGGSALALDDAARTAGQQQNQADLGVQQQNADLQEKNRLVGLSGLNSLYDTNAQQGLQYLNLANNAKPTFWQQFGENAANTALRGITAAAMA